MWCVARTLGGTPEPVQVVVVRVVLVVVLVVRVVRVVRVGSRLAPGRKPNVSVFWRSWLP